MDSKEKPLKDKVRTWVESQGYPLELEVAHAFNQASFDVEMSNIYTDSETGVLREIDITAYLRSHPTGPTSIEVCCQIECKSSSNAPWIIFSKNPLPVPAYWSYSRNINSLIARDFTFSRLYVAKDTSDEITSLTRRLEDTVFQESYAGHTLTQAFTTGADIPYKAVTSAVKASLDRVKTNDDAFYKGLGSTSYVTTTVFPVVVIDTPLFLAFLNEDGTTTVEEIPSALLDWKRIGPSILSHCGVHVVTKAALPQFIQDVTIVSDVFTSIIKRNPNFISQAISSIRKQASFDVS